MAVFEELLANGAPEKGERGRHVERIGVLLELSDARARLSRSETKGRPFSALAELLWYLSGSDRLDYIERYIPKYAKDAEDNGTLHGAYGPRLLNMGGQNQIANVIAALRERPSTKRAVIQLFSAEDIASRYKEVPCTIALQFFIRDEKLLCCSFMRSNDAFKGLPHDVFCFTMLQEIIARELDVELGPYRHLVSSLHLYEDSINAAQAYLTEGVQSSLAMPPMPAGSQWQHISNILVAEDKVRRGELDGAIDVSLPTYWQDLIRLLMAFESRGDSSTIDELIGDMESPVYRTYLQRWKALGPRKAGKD